MVLPLLALLAAAAAPTQLTVLAAASLRQPLLEGARAFEQAHPGVTVSVSAAASGALEKQIEQGAPADVYVAAAEAPMAALRSKGLVGPERIVARNALVVAVPKGRPDALAGLGDLRGPAFKRIAVGRPATVPAGDYAREALERVGLWEALAPRFVYGVDVSQVLSYLKGGDVDAAFVYRTDAELARDDVRVALIVSAALHAPVVYPAAMISRTQAPVLARAWLDFLAGPQGQAILRGHGFLPP